MSTLVVDTLTGKSTATTLTIGSTPVVSASANSLTIRGEGSAQTSVQQGLIKSWVNFDGTASGAAARDSFNLSSMTDDGTGAYTITFSSNLANANFCVGGMGVHDAGSYVSGPYVDNDATPLATTRIKIDGMAPNTLSNTDGAHFYIDTKGDLA
jgi:hypothetical protein